MILVNLSVCVFTKKLNSEEIYRHQIHHSRITYYRVYGDGVSNRYRHPFENGVHKAEFLEIY